MKFRIPTSDECSKNEKVFAINAISNIEEEIGFACWYPQMGGYCGKCIVLTEPSENNCCFDVYIWHDGEFPFTEEGRNPYELHHCSAEQFIDFGNLIKNYQEKNNNDSL
jgi:hypothetical protein